ncbi:MAG: hypothetical protein ABSG14_07685 [Verrucomicrobiia bacterium]|jgi:hypothetical protein
MGLVEPASCLFVQPNEFELYRRFMSADPLAARAWQRLQSGDVETIKNKQWLAGYKRICCRGRLVLL